MDCVEAREALALGERPEAHLSACAACRQAEKAYAVLKARLQGFNPPLPAGLRARIVKMAQVRRFPWKAAAALLLAAIPLVYLSRREEKPASPKPVVEASYPRSLGSSGRVEVLPEAGLVAAPGARARLLSLSEARLEGGRVLVRASKGFRLHTPFGICEATEDDALFEARCGEARALSWIREARAEEASGELLVVKGSVTLRLPDGRVLQAGAGRLLRIDGKVTEEVLEATAVASRIAWRDGEAPWEPLWTGRLEGSRRILPLPEVSRFVWEATLRRPAGGYIEVVLPCALPEGEVLTVGELPELGDGKEHTLTLRWDLAPVLLLDGTRVVRELPARLPSPGARIGLGVANGTLEVISWRWRPLP